MKPLSVLVYDDHVPSAELWSENIESVCSRARATLADASSFSDLSTLLNQRRASWRDDPGSEEMIRRHEIDQADVVVIDYDLFDYPASPNTTGRRMAYLLRCFTTCGLIIVLNEYGDNVFDLRLSSSADDFADVHVGDKQIGNPGLWGAPFHGYRPWYWPSIPLAVDNFLRCVEDVVSNPSTPILEFFGLQNLIDWIPWQARDFLSIKEDVSAVTFEEFAKSAPGGIERRDELGPGQRARVTAARIVRILNSVVLPEQGVLVDAPHLVDRFPSLISGEKNRDTLNMLCQFDESVTNHLSGEQLERHRFRQPHWLWRPAWYWPEVIKGTDVIEVTEPWNTEELDFVFCEDISRFVPSDVAQDFRADVASPFSKRYRFDSRSEGAKEIVPTLGDGSANDPSEVRFFPESASSL